jgi:uncharacterized repeat protein (TIGR04138 family)
MPHDIDFWKAVERIRAVDDRFEPEVYDFTMQALEYTIQRVGERRHVRAEELLDGLSGYARLRFGLLAADVLAKWGVRSASDVGAVVFQMVDAGILARQESDRREDFNRGFDLKRSLEDSYFD